MTWKDETASWINPTRIVVFGFDVAEAAQIRRIRAFESLGYDVHSFTMRRANMNAGFQPDWPNTHLFCTDNEKLLKRAGVVAASMLKMSAHCKVVASADVIIARNLDMLAIAWAARLQAGATHVPLVYECLDINGSLSRDTGASRAMRRAERFLLDRTALLVVSSPGFIREYFDTRQKYQGPWALWENKLAAGAELPDRPTRVPERDATQPFRLGWVGTIRCRPSLLLLAETARRLGGNVEIRIHGVIHRHAIPDFDDILAAHPNITFCGPYAYPGDLARVYGECDMVWSQDLWQRGSNSDWLLPNRIYEASWCGCPSIALADTETGRRIVADELGWVIARPDPEQLAGLVYALSAADVRACGQALLDRPATDFAQSDAEIRDVIDLAMRVAAPAAEPKGQTA